MSDRNRIRLSTLSTIFAALVCFGCGSVAFGATGSVLILTDCNSNGIDDATDIAGATSEDCNSNAVPDECDIESSPVVQGTSTPQVLNSSATEDFGDDYQPQLATSRAGTFIAVWTLYGYTDDLYGPDQDILFARSADGGRTWSPTAPLNANAETDVRDDTYARLTTDGAGNWIVVWESTDTLGRTIGTDPDILYAVSTDDGQSWSWPAPLNGTAVGDSAWDREPAIATDDQGTWITVWGADDLNGTIGTDRDILFAVSTDLGQNWTYPQVLNTNAPTDVRWDVTPRIATDRSGRWVVIWNSAAVVGGITSDFDLQIARSLNDGATWSTPAFLNSNAGSDSLDDIRNEIVTDGLGVWICVWATYPPYRVYTARSTDDGATWSNPLRLDQGAGGVEPSLALDSAGQWIVAWEARGDPNGTIGNDYDVLFSESVDGGVTWSDAAPLHADAGSDSREDHSARIAVDTAGNWNVLSINHDDLGGTVGSDSDLFVTRFGAAGSKDCNSNGVPDECDADCDGNGVPDQCEVPGDMNHDGDVDNDDMGQYISCLTGPCVAGLCWPPLYVDECCAAADLDFDGDVDLRDFSMLRFRIEGLCGSDSDCDDGLFCTGEEVCTGGECQVGEDPCAGDPVAPYCDETLDSCLECVPQSVSLTWWSSQTEAVNVVLSGSENLRLGSATSGYLEGEVALPGFGVWTLSFGINPDGDSDADPNDYVDLFIDGVFQARYFNGPHDAPYYVQATFVGALLNYRFEFVSSNNLTTKHIVVMAGTASGAPGDCDDGLFCTGVETCELGACVSSGNPCGDPALPICDEASDSCVGCTVDTDCDDGLFCTGVETCESGACVSSGAPCGDPSLPICDEASDSCVGCTVDANCDDGLFCTGVETCNEGACQSAGDPCAGDPLSPVCDEASDSCVEAECVFESVPLTWWSSRTETVNVVLSSTENLRLGSATSGYLEGEVALPGFGVWTLSFGINPDGDSDADPNDYVDLFIDGVFEARYFNGPNDPPYSVQATFVGDRLDYRFEFVSSNSSTTKHIIVMTGAATGWFGDCDDGLFCTGVETCESGVCISSGNPCGDPALPICDEASDVCVGCTVDADCDDGLFCTGEETCVEGSCQSSGDPCAGDPIAPLCEETSDSCIECIEDGDCDDGLFCTGSETCVEGACQAGTDPCAADPLAPVCDEAVDSCVECVFETVPLTWWSSRTGLLNVEQSSSENLRLGTATSGYLEGQITLPNTGNWTLQFGINPDTDLGASPDDYVDLFINGDFEARYYNGTSDPPYPVTVDYVGDLLNYRFEFQSSTTVLTAHVIVMTGTAIRSLGVCDDGLFCTGEETCESGMCVSAGDPCVDPALPVCYESGDVCICDSDATCDDGQFCTGEETCVGGACQSSGNPCAGDPLLPVCEEETDSCVECIDLEVPLNWWSNRIEAVDVVRSGLQNLRLGSATSGYLDGQVVLPGFESWVLRFGINPDLDPGANPNDYVDLFINGEFEARYFNGPNDPPYSVTVDHWGDLLNFRFEFVSSTSDPTRHLIVMTGKASAAVGDCDDGLFCTGEETCESGFCVSGGDPCAGSVLPFCDEVGDSCMECAIDADCDDGEFCTGTETCAGGACFAGIDPCVGSSLPVCDEEFDVCTTGTIYAEGFDSYDCGGDPTDWFDTDADGSLVQNDAIFDVACLIDTKAFHTASTATNIHSHYVGTGSETWASIQYSGRMQVAAVTGGIGVSFLSQYPSAALYYRLRRHQWTQTFHISPSAGVSIPVGTRDTGVNPSPGVWYQFLIEAVDTGARTEIRAKVWQDGSQEPANWQIDCYDDTGTRLTNGTIGVWSMGAGQKYWDDLKADALTP